MIQELKQQAAYDNSYSSESNQKPEGTLNQGIWQQEQILKFMVFTSSNLHILASKFQRRTVKIFKQMSRFIGTRTSTQCRSQNQKLIKKHKNIKKILKAYEAQIGKSEFEKAINMYSDQLKAVQSVRKKQKQNITKNRVSVFTQTQFSDDSQQEKDDLIKVEQQGDAVRASRSTQFHPFLRFPIFSNSFI